MRPERRSTFPGWHGRLVSYCDAVEVERASFVGNSLGCPIIVELATMFPDRIERVVLVSPAGGPNNRPLARALRQMAMDGLREPPSMLPIAVRDYLRFGVLQSLSLFKAMTRYPTLERLPHLVMPTLVIAGARDPLVRLDRVSVLAVLPHVDAVKVPGAHALNYSAPDLIAELIEAHLADGPLATSSGPRTGRRHPRHRAEMTQLANAVTQMLRLRLSSCFGVSDLVDVEELESEVTDPFEEPMKRRLVLDDTGDERVGLHLHLLEDAQSVTGESSPDSQLVNGSGQSDTILSSRQLY